MQQQSSSSATRLAMLRWNRRDAEAKRSFLVRRGGISSGRTALPNISQLGLQGRQHLQLRRLERSVHFSTHITKQRQLVAAMVLN